ncbi:Group II intron, maturase-specific domain [Rubripirellula lacrimiformis]|uniref:Group II intron, maturase-specific domain n=1 Tax=Rubripirellula lacrimiformis TaxID=1930273 RepID=A0A517NA38_9BACT|nr:group II intron maturase-specific domain-containing protein [Rubripirellula lacrimiformis]QDT03868.1 Group II intron, maturase-specific domain [Rubripirellula lacrimiformis]
MLHWEATVADVRIHGTTRKQVRDHFDAAEKNELLPLPTERFANFSEARRKVNRDGHVAIDHAFYSAPPEYVGRSVWARWDVRRFKQRVREITGRSRGISMDRRLGELRRYVRGWMGYFGIASQLKLFDKLDQWIRRRIRMCYWKRPKRRRTMLIRLGVPRRQAIRHARSRKGYWRMAKTIASNVGLTNKWLQEQGLLSMKTLWAELAPLRRTA